ncbi:MAG: hydroxyisourate hydrolase [Solirubrobacterales bacterium]
MATGRLTTHVLDTMLGGPATGLGVTLWRLDGEGRPSLLTETRTNADGRTGRPLLQGAELEAGRYELSFAVGDYYAEQGVALPDPPFLDLVPIWFGVADISATYHVPLLVGPWSFATYRGS